jgi:hypothetical protein
MKASEQDYVASQTWRATYLPPARPTDHPVGVPTASLSLAKWNAFGGIIISSLPRVSAASARRCYLAPARRRAGTVDRATRAAPTVGPGWRTASRTLIRHQSGSRLAKDAFLGLGSMGAMAASRSSEHV